MPFADLVARSQSVPEKPPISPIREEEDAILGMPPAFRYLFYVELIFVGLIAIVSIAAILYSIIWVICGLWPEVHERLVSDLKQANAAWKVGLLLLVPLFFRPVFKFLIFLREVRGMKSGLEPKEKPKEEAGYEPDRQLHL
jgi:hypothetical protein